jgi:proline iminopeptidase
LEGEQVNSRAWEQFVTVNAARYDVRPHLPHIRIPTLIVVTELDYLAPRFAARELRRIPDSEIATLSGAGHFPFLDASLDFRTVVARFLLRSP